MDGTLNIALAQIAPVWLDFAATRDKIVASIDEAGSQGADLVAFGEALLPGYPFWVDRTDGARFESDLQKDLYAHYVDHAVSVERGDLDTLCAAAARNRTAVYVGMMERDARRGMSLYCTMAYIDRDGVIGSTHRKLVPTYEERLVWAAGDGAGLKTHALGDFTVGGLNCWENWLPLARASLYGQGEDLHVAIWPGSQRNTHDITRFIAKEARSYVLSVSGLMRDSDIPDGLPHVDRLRDTADAVMADGGSCIAAPSGDWVLEPITGVECVRTATIEHAQVRRERQNLDVSGHYSRPDVTRLQINRQRQSTLQLDDGQS
ncbi:MAG: carbon-nitrogen hydrolase family protein [Pseudomonadota bacterium]